MELPDGYSLKSTKLGYCVIGAYGFYVSGYHDTEHEAIKTAIEAIHTAMKEERFPVWML